MKNELLLIEKNGTWKFFYLPKDKKALPCKWVYKLKFAFSDANHKYKGCLVIAKGSNKNHGIDFEEIFSLVAKIMTLAP